MGKKAFGLEALKQFMVNVAGTEEEISWSLFDFTTYAAAGQLSLPFFQTPLGQGGKTIADTNMDLAGQIPKGQNFVVQSITVEFFSGADANDGQVTNDQREFLENGTLIFTVGSKTYIQQSPLGQFPQQYGLDGFVSVDDPAVTLILGDSHNSGNEYEIIPINLVSNQNFKVTLAWPALVPMPSNLAGRIGVRLNGRLFRNAQ